MKNYGLCSHCGERIKPFEAALTDWLCERCYYENFPRFRRVEQENPDDLFNSRIENEESYEFLKKNLYDKPLLYQRSFIRVRDYSVFFRNFTTLKSMLSFLKTVKKSIISQVKEELVKLDKTHRWLRPEIVEMLLFILWDRLVKKYGRGERFSESYWDLICELESHRKDAEFAEKIII